MKFLSAANHLVKIHVMLDRLLRLAPRNDGGLMDVLCAMTLSCARLLRDMKHPNYSDCFIFFFSFLFFIDKKRNKKI